MIQKIKTSMQEGWNNPRPQDFKSKIYYSISILILTFLYLKIIETRIVFAGYYLENVLVYVALFLYSDVQMIVNLRYFKIKEIPMAIRIIGLIISFLPVILNITLILLRVSSLR